MGKQAIEKKSQSEKFKEAARELGCDESEENFDKALRTIAKQKPKAHQPKKRATGKASG